MRVTQTLLLTSDYALRCNLKEGGWEGSSSLDFRFKRNNKNDILNLLYDLIILIIYNKLYFKEDPLLISFGTDIT